MRKALVAALAVLASSLVAAPSTAVAADDPCPQGVREARGTNPTQAAVEEAIYHAGTDYVVPWSILRGIAYHESMLRQFDAAGDVLAPAAGACKVGIMGVDVTGYAEADAVRVASDYVANVRESARLLRESWFAGHERMWPAGVPLPDEQVVENWFHPLCLYAACGTDPWYPTRISEIVSDPLRRVVPDMRGLFDLGGFTTPMQADRSYVFPAPFKALRAGTFDYYDATGTTLLRSVPAYVQVRFPQNFDKPPYRPDGMSRHHCAVDCGLWRLDGRYGIDRSAHFTDSTATTDTARMTWWPSATGRYHVTMWIPWVPETLGAARYVVAGSPVTVDQEAAKGGEAYLGDFTLSTYDTIVLGNANGVPGQLVAAATVSIRPVPKVDLAVSPRTVTTGGEVVLTATVTHLGTTNPPYGGNVTFYRRAVGATAWTMMRSVWKTDGKASLVTRPTAHTEYTARTDVWRNGPGDAPDIATRYASNDVRADVRPLVKASLSRTSAPRNVAVTLTASVSPSHAGQQVVLQRWVSGSGWRDSLVRTLDGSSAASFTFAKNTAGTYLYRVLKRADADHLDGVSPTLRLTVT